MRNETIDRAEAPFGAWQREIVFEAKYHRHRTDKGQSVQDEVGVRQEELLAAVRGGPTAFVPYLRRRLRLDTKASIRAPTLPRRALTVNEYVNPPLELEVELGRAWADEITPSQASKPVFWLLAHIDWISQGRLGTGDLRDILTGTGNLTNEQRTRNLLRRTGGIPHVRGKTSVFSDCTLARAWWRHRLADDVARVTNGTISARRAHQVLHVNRPSWEQLVMLSLRRLTVINQPRARAAIIREMAQRLQMYGKIQKEQVYAMAVSVARLGLRHSLDHLDDEAMARVLARVRAS